MKTLVISQVITCILFVNSSHLPTKFFSTFSTIHYYILTFFPLILQQF